MKKKIRKIFFRVLLILIIGSIVYNIYDNNRFKVVEQEVVIDGLPQSFDGFKILQISDLHGKYFGKSQSHLLHAINNLEYDMIAFTGDMNKNEDRAIESSKPIFDLLEGIKNKEYMFWVDGNTGPYAIENINGCNTGELTEIGVMLQEKGCKILTLPYKISRENDTIWIVPEMSEVTFSLYESTVDEYHVSEKEKNEKIRKYTRISRDMFNKINDTNEVKIMLDHYPIQTNLTKQQWEDIGWIDCDLILAGHYHGGQFRIPFYGALYIPSPTSGIKSGYFPNQNEVKGLCNVSGIPQYISAGLGASSSLRIFGFRLFNTPEINIITLKYQ